MRIWRSRNRADPQADRRRLSTLGADAPGGVRRCGAVPDRFRARILAALVKDNAYPGSELNARVRLVQHRQARVMARSVPGRVSGGQQYLYPGVDRARRRGELVSVDPLRHDHVAEDQIDAPSAKDVESFGAVERGDHVIAEVPDRP